MVHTNKSMDGRVDFSTSYKAALALLNSTSNASGVNSRGGLSNFCSHSHDLNDSPSMPLTRLLGSMVSWKDCKSGSHVGSDACLIQSSKSSRNGRERVKDNVNFSTDGGMYEARSVSKPYK
jgi:hypothetical protein